MAAVNVGIGHDDDLVVAQLGDVKVLANPGAQRGDDRLELVVVHHLVHAALFHVEHLAPEGEDGLGLGVPPLLGRPACGVSLDDVDLALGGVFERAVGELCREAEPQARLAAGGILRLPRGDAGSRFPDGLLQYLVHNLRVLLAPEGQLFLDQVVHEAAHLGVAELGLGLPLKLRLGYLHRKDGGQAGADVLAGQLFRHLGVLVVYPL